MKNGIYRYVSIALLVGIAWGIFGCSQVNTLNLQKHKFGTTPFKIVWLQVAGLSEEHLAMLRFAYPSTTQKTSFEYMQCIGKAWNYNLYDIRPSAKNSFLSQLTGKKNIKQSCDDYGPKPIWGYLEEYGYSSGIFEIGANRNNSLESSAACTKGKYLQNATMWRMNKKTDSNSLLFHLSEKTDFDKGKIYYDRSCQKKECFSGVLSNVRSVFERYRRNKSKYLFLIRDFSYLKALQDKRTGDAREILREIDRIVEYFRDAVEFQKDALILLTTAASVKLDFPKKGKDWQKFEASGKKLIFGNKSVVSSVFALGARSENFCGFYEESDILTRIISAPKYKGFEFNIFDSWN